MVRLYTADALDALGKEVSAGRSARLRVPELEEENKAKADEVKRAREREQELEAELKTRRVNIQGLEAQVSQLRKTVEVAQDQIAAGSKLQKKVEKKPKPPRRVRVPGDENEGVYSVTTQAGVGEFNTFFEIGFKDATGRQRWKRLDHADIEKARAERAPASSAGEGMPWASASD